MKPKRTLFPLILRAGLLLLLVTLNYQAATVHAQGTAFTYQGHLSASGQPANGSYDFSFSLFNADTDGSPIGGSVPKAGTAVINGLFTVTLDFGPAFQGANRWLEIAVATNGAALLNILTPRQKLTPSPYAITAGSLSGIIPLAQLPAPVLTNNQVGVNLNGSFSGNGAGLSFLNAANLTSGTITDARLSANVPLLSAGDLLLPRHLTIDNADLNDGAIRPGLTFGFGSGEGIASRRTPGGNRWGLDLFTFFQPRLSIGHGGNVGIGTTNAQALLHVNGATRIDADAVGYNEGLSVNLPSEMFGGGYGGIHFHSAPRGAAYTSDTIKWGMFYNYSSIDGAGTVGGNGLAFVQNNSQTRLYLGTNGNVGIGTNRPSSKLEVNGTISASALRAPGAGRGTSTFAFVHEATIANVANPPGATRIDNPMCNGDANAILMVTTREWGSGSTPALSAVGVIYDGTSHWYIYNLNSTQMVPPISFNVLVIKN